MTTAAFVTLNGAAVAELTLHVSESGPWWADVSLETIPKSAPMGGVKLVINGATLVGTVDPQRDGAFGEQRRFRVVAGAGGWGKAIKRHGYANDAAVKCRTIADDAAKLVGETIGTFSSSRERLNAHYAREAGPASIALDDAKQDGVWWVDYAGVTHVAKARPTTKAAANAYEVLNFSPVTRVVELGVTGLTVGVGSIISERLEQPETIRSFTLRVTGQTLTMTAVCGEAQTTNQLERLFQAIIDRIIDRRRLGKYRYRVVNMSPDGRVDVQALSTKDGGADLLRVEQWPGVAGAHAELSPGAMVIVEFLDGRRDLPVITGYAGKQASSYVPLRLILGGNDAVAEVACKGDSVELLFPPMVVSGTMVLPAGPTAFSGVGFQPTGKLLGVITTGTNRVLAGRG